MSAVAPEFVVRQLNWRYATRRFDSQRSIPTAEWDALEQALVLTPSSFGLQPWRFVVLTDRELRERLVGHSWGQRQVADCSHFVVFCIRREVGAAEIEAHVQRVVEVRGTPGEKLAGFRKSMVSTLVEGPLRPVVNEWATRQVYIALGNFMTSAAMLGIDTCPMEGFDPAAYDRELGLTDRGFAAVVACAAGYRSADDRHADQPKVRFRREDIIERR